MTQTVSRTLIPNVWEEILAVEIGQTKTIGIQISGIEPVAVFIGSEEPGSNEDNFMVLDDRRTPSIGTVCEGGDRVYARAMRRSAAKVRFFVGPR